MPRVRTVFVLCACLGVSPVVWGDTGLVVQTVIPASSVGELSVSGDTIAASVPSGFRGSDGTEIYTQQASGEWQMTQSLATPGPEALSGNEIILGDRSDALFQANPVIIYASSGNGVWTEQASLIAADITTCDWFGSAVAIDGNVAVIGAQTHGGGAPDPWCHPAPGAAYVFERDATGTWVQTAELLPPATQSINDFGQIVAVSGNTILVRAIHEQTSVGSVSMLGETFVYTQQSFGNWTQTAVIPGPGILGTLAIAGDEVAVQSNSVPVDIYTLSTGGQPTLLQTLSGTSVALTGPPGQIFGTGIALSSSLLLIVAGGNSTMCPEIAGANIPPCQSIATQGGVYAYTLSAGRWQPINVYAPANLALTALGDSVSTDGVTAVASSAQGIAVMQLGSVPAGDVVVPSYQVPPPGSTSSDPPDPPAPTASAPQHPSSGGGALGFIAVMLLGVLWSCRGPRAFRER
ncbi:MAG: FG-GAP repeat protein [Gammaproteobacteria bacterium]